MAGEAQIQQQARMRAATGEAADKAGIGVDPKTSADTAKIVEKAAKLKKEVAEHPSAPARSLSEGLTRLDAGGTPEQADAAITANIKDTARKDIIDKANNAIKLIVEGDPGKIVWGDAARGFDVLEKSLDSILAESGFSYLTEPGLEGPKRTFYENLLKDQKFVAAIRARWGEVSSERISDDAEAAKNKADEAKAKADAARDRKQRASDEHTRLKGRADALRPGGSDYAEYTRLKGKKFRLPTEITTAQGVLTRANAALIRAETALNADSTNPTLITDRDNAQAALTSAEGTLNTLHEDKGKLDVWEQEERENPAKLNAADQDLTAAVKDVATLEREEKDALAAHSSAILRRGEAEAKFVRSMQGVVRDGVARQLDANLQEVDVAAKTQLEKDTQEETDKFGKALGEFAMQRYWKDRNGEIKWYSRDKSHKIEQKGLAHEDILKLLKNGNSPDTLVREYFKSVGIHDEAEIAKTMKANPEIVKKWGGKMAEQAMGIYLRTGGKLSTQDNIYLVSQEWGVGLIEKAIASSDIVKAKEKELKEKGILSGGGLVEWMKKNKGKTALIAALLALLLGTFVAGGGGFAPGAVSAAVSGIQPMLMGVQGNMQAFSGF